MQTFKVAFWAIIFSFCFSAFSSYGADIAKIGVVDFQRILETSSAGKSAQAEINAKGKIMEKALKEKGAEIEELKKKLEREALVMSKEKKDEKEREVRIKINDFKALQKQYLTEFQELEQGLVKTIRNKVFELVEEMGKKEGYLLIIERRGGGLLYFPNTIDITDKLIQQFNDAYARKGD
jgi:outer membrane protein